MPATPPPPGPAPRTARMALAYAQRLMMLASFMCSSTREYIFSQMRGTAKKTVGLISCRLVRTVSRFSVNDTVYPNFRGA